MSRRRVARAAVVVAAALLVAACGGSSRNAGSSSDVGLDGGRGAAGAAKVVKIVDGDTIRVRIGGRVERVRFIGVDTPETHGPGGLRECFGKEATVRTASLLPVGTQVDLVRDVDARDRYQRLLAYVYRKRDGLFVNLELAKDGFAVALTIPPNIAHVDEFVRAAGVARDRNIGLWATCGGADKAL